VTRATTTAPPCHPAPARHHHADRSQGRRVGDPARPAPLRRQAVNSRRSAPRP
jgi:hypothetical protein